MKTKDLNVLRMAEAVIEVLKLFIAKLILVPKLEQLRDELKAMVTRYHELNQSLVLESEYATLKKGKRNLLERAAEVLANQVLLYATMQDKPEVAVKVDLYYKDIFSIGGDKLLDTCKELHKLAKSLLAELTDYHVDATGLASFMQLITDFETLLSAPRMDISARAAIKMEMEGIISAIRAHLHTKMDVAMNIVKNTEKEFFDAYTSSRVIVDLRGKRNITKPEDETTGMISGTITDFETGEPMVDVIVQLEGTEIATSTDENGEFVFDLVVPGICSLTCIKETYKNLQLPGIEVKAGEEIEVEGAMEKEA
jgi:hypothetical protein